MHREAPALPCATGSPAAPRPRHAHPTRQHKVSSTKERVSTPTSASGVRGKEPSLGRLARSLERSGPAGSERFPTFQEVFPSRFSFFVSPVWGVHCVEGVFPPGMEKYHPPGTFFSYPRVLYFAFELCQLIIYEPSLEERGEGETPGADLLTAPFQHPYTRKSAATPSGVTSISAGLPPVRRTNPITFVGGLHLLVVNSTHCHTQLTGMYVTPCQHPSCPVYYCVLYAGTLPNHIKAMPT